MLIALSIRDFLLIRTLDLELGDGFSALTGETGGGKSVLLSALGFTLGQTPRGGGGDKLIRADAAAAQVSASFEPSPVSRVWGRLAAQGIDASPSDVLVLKRIVKRGGAARSFINDQAASARFLSEIGDHLVEMHGQHASHALLSDARHCDMLDGYAEAAKDVSACAAAWARWRAAIEKREALEARAEQAAADHDYLSHALDELDALAPETGEAAALAKERAALQSAEQAAAALGDAAQHFGRGGIETGLTSAAKALARAEAAPALQHAEADDCLRKRIQAARDAVERALIEAEEAATAVMAAQSDARPSPAALERAESRLFALRALARKHEDDPDQLPRLREEIAGKLHAIENNTNAAASALKDEAAARAAYVGAAEALSRRREQAAITLEKAMRRELKPLKLGGMRFRTRLTRLPLEAAGPHGWDAAAFEIAPRAEAAFGALGKIASGGELARVALALRVCLARVGDTPTLIFDEVDTGVGGATAAAVGARLKALATTRQVLAVTHSPQVAAAADAQWRISKRDRRGRLETRMEDLADKDRLEEIARMLAGAEITAEARAAADRLLAPT